MTFEWPSILYGLALIPILLALYLLAQRRRRAYAVRFTNLALLKEVVGRRPGVRRHIPPLLFLLGLTALLVSLARPSAVIATPREQASVMLVMDVSGSMTAEDLRPNRLEAAKQAARSFVEALPKGTRIGLASFSTRATLNAPLTEDTQVVVRSIDRLRADGGTAIGDGLQVAIDHLRDHVTDGSGEAVPGLVVLLSDGQSSSGISPRVAAERARDAGVRVHTVGIGQRGVVAQASRRQPVGLDEATLREIADTTAGQYFYAAETSELQKIYADLGAQVRWVEERTEVTALVSALGTLFVIIGGLFGLRWFQQFP